MKEAFNTFLDHLHILLIAVIVTTFGMSATQTPTDSSGTTASQTSEATFELSTTPLVPSQTSMNTELDETTSTASSDAPSPSVSAASAMQPPSKTNGCSSCGQQNNIDSQIHRDCPMNCY